MDKDGQTSTRNRTDHQAPLMTKTVAPAYQVARIRHRNSRFPVDSLPLSTWPDLSFQSGEGVPPPQLCILYLYCYSKTGQDQGNFRALGDELRFTERSRLAINRLSKTVRSSADASGRDFVLPLACDSTPKPRPYSRPFHAALLYHLPCAIIENPQPPGQGRRFSNLFQTLGAAK